jgi:tRNA-guanine family transglycosylase
MKNLEFYNTLTIPYSNTKDERLIIDINKYIEYIRSINKYWMLNIIYVDKYKIFLDNSSIKIIDNGAFQYKKGKNVIGIYDIINIQKKYNCDYVVSLDYIVNNNDNINVLKNKFEMTLKNVKLWIEEFKNTKSSILVPMQIPYSSINMSTYIKKFIEYIVQINKYSNIKRIGIPMNSINDKYDTLSIIKIIKESMKDNNVNLDIHLLGAGTRTSMFYLLPFVKSCDSSLCVIFSSTGNIIFDKLFIVKGLYGKLMFKTSVYDDNNNKINDEYDKKKFLYKKLMECECPVCKHDFTILFDTIDYKLIYLHNLFTANKFMNEIDELISEIKDYNDYLNKLRLFKFKNSDKYILLDSFYYLDEV